MSTRAGGIKVSSHLAQLDIARAAGSQCTPTDLLRRLSAERINIAFLMMAGPGSDLAASLCVAAEDRARSEAVALEVLGVDGGLAVVAPVVAVSVYPHRATATFLATLLRALAGQGLRVHALATSLAAVTFTLAAADLARALGALDRALVLPENHAPLRWDLRVKQVPA